MRRHLGGSAVCMLVLTSSVAWASGRMGEIHEYCGEANAIVVGRPVSFTGGAETSAEFEVEQWVKPLATTQPTGRPNKLRLSGGHGSFTGQTFHKLAQKGRFLVFVFPGGRTGDGRLGSIIEIGEKGALPQWLELCGAEVQPRTADALVARIRRILSKEYTTALMERVANTELRDPQRAEAARCLGALYVKEAWKVLETQATRPGRDEESAVARESLLAMFRIDEPKTTPICLGIVRDSRYDYQVGTAAWLLSRRPSKDPNALDVLLAACRRWEVQARYPADRPLPRLIQAATVSGRRTPEVEAMVMRNVEKGAGNVLVTSMSAAGQMKIRQAVPFICRQLKSEDKTIDLRGSASLALTFLVGNEFRRYGASRLITEEEARQAAAEAYPGWRKAWASATTIECRRGDRVVIASEGEQQMYVLVGWQMRGPTEFAWKVILLYRTDEPTTKSPRP